MTRTLALLALAAGLLGSLSDVAHAQDITVNVGRGPIAVNVPASYDSASPMPLVVLLHGYGSSGAIQEFYMQFRPLSDERGFLFASPDGLRDSSGRRYWNGTDACCDFEGETDDSSYLRSLIEEIQGALNVDDRRIYLIGHSNGGYMSYRMACDHADLIAAIAPLAGVTFLDPLDCQPSEPVSVLHMHGTIDSTVRYDGGCFGGDTACYPSAEDSLAMWGDYNGCDLVQTPGRLYNYDRISAGRETQVTDYVAGCPEGGALAFWKMSETEHIPFFTRSWNDAVIDFLMANPKP